MDTTPEADEAAGEDGNTLELVGTEGGSWQVTTASSTRYIFDLDLMTVTRWPVRGAATTINDTTRPIDIIHRCRVGESGFWTMRLEPGDPFEWQDYWSISTAIESIERLGSEARDARP